MTNPYTRLPVLATLVATCAYRAPPADAPARDRIGHRRHFHRHNASHPASPDPARFHSPRDGALLDLPREDDAFFFAVFGDRTGGPAEGVAVLADAVHDVNLLEPDLVMTVGDLVEGYNQAPEWLEQMQEFKGIMDQLLCPWFPVAGNHDIYWRGPKGAQPAGEHETRYEVHFGPLWYAFEHKNCWFIALYSDEGNPDTDEKNFRKPECQQMSPAQLTWLERILAQAAGADHVFCFLHHPRWLRDNYGDDWDKVHDLLVRAGNVTAVFAGHIHHMRYDPRDGIDYVTLATVGGHQSGKVPEAGYLHQYHLVTVRKNQVALAAVPVGDIMDVREITGHMQDECVRLAQQEPLFDGVLPIARDGSAHASIRATLTNTASRPVDVTVWLDSPDPRWSMPTDHAHARLAPGVSRTFELDAARTGAIDQRFHPLELTTQMAYLAEGCRYALPERRDEVPLDVVLPALPEPATEQAFWLDGAEGFARIAARDLMIPDGPFTLECWFNAHDFDRRTGLISKTENSEYGLFVSDGQPSFYVFLGDDYVTAEGASASLSPSRWHHLAGVYDGREVRLYLDGVQVAAVAGSGPRRTNEFPLIIGGDVNAAGQAVSHFAGAIDEVRLSGVARYTADFTPPRRVEADADTRLLLHMDGQIGPWLIDASPAATHPRAQGGAHVAAAVH